MTIELPYGTTRQTLELPEHVCVEVLESSAHIMKAGLPGGELVRRAMEEPFASPRLRELAKGKENAVIICSDHTRPVPSKLIIPQMLRELREGSPEIRVTLLIATGFHRASTREELIAKFGVEIVERENIIIHDCSDEANLRRIGTLPSGAPLVINRVAAGTELLLSEGFIEPHFFAGYSGGRKSVLPGICGRETVLGNHCSAFLANPHARTGVLEHNPIHRDMLAAAEMAGLRYIVNVVIDADKNIIAAFAGDREKAHEAGCGYLRELCRVTPSRPGDIVLTSNGGAPLDQNIYQAVKGMSAAEAAAAKDAVLILSAACADGSGSDGFHRMLRDCGSPEALLKEILLVPQNKTAPDQWEAQILARILAKHRVILVCDPEIRPIAREMKLSTAGSVADAFQMALGWKGGNARVTVIPDGVSVVVMAAGG